MEESNEQICEDRDLTKNSKSFISLWGIPIVLIIIASFGGARGWWPLSTETILWGIAVVWIGASCYINGRRCGRIHCKILGVLYPILGAVGVLTALGIISLDLNVLNIALGVFLVGSFTPELFGKKYM